MPEEQRVYDLMHRMSHRFRQWGLEPEDVAHDAYLLYLRQNREPVLPDSHAWTLVHQVAATEVRKRQAWKYGGRVTTLSMGMLVAEELQLGDVIADPMDVEELVIARLELAEVLRRMTRRPGLVVLLFQALGYRSREEQALLKLGRIDIKVRRTNARRILSRPERRGSRGTSVPSLLRAAGELRRVM